MGKVKLMMDNTVRRAFENIWGGMKGRILVVPSTFRTRENKLACGEGCLYSLNLLLPILRAMYDPNLITIDFGENLSPKDYENHNLILLGGPVKNKITEVFMSEEEREKMELRFYFKDSTLLDTEDDSLHLRSGIKKGKLDDYGVAVKRLGHPKKGKRLYMLAGLRMFATQAGMVLLTQPMSVQAISEKFEDRDFEIRFERKGICKPGDDPVRITFPNPLNRIEFSSAQVAGRKEIRELASPSCAAVPFHLDVSSLLGLIAVLGGFGLVVAGILADISYCLTGGAGCVVIGLVHLVHERIRR